MTDEPKPRRSVVAHPGKVARLPVAVRLDLNRRMFAGEKAAETLAWLNGLPEVRGVLSAHFGGNAVTPAQLATWRAGGYVEWEAAEKERRARLAPLEAGAEGAAAQPGAKFLRALESIGSAVAEASDRLRGVAGVPPFRVESVEVKGEANCLLSLVVNGEAAEVPPPDFRLLARGVVIMRGGPPRPAIVVNLPRRGVTEIADATADLVVVELVRRALYRTRLMDHPFYWRSEIPSLEEAQAARWEVNTRRETLRPKGNTHW